VSFFLKSTFEEFVVNLKLNSWKRCTL